MLVYTFLYGVGLCDCMIFDTVMHKDLVRSLSVTFCQALYRVKDILCPIWRFLFDNHLTRAYADKRLTSYTWHSTPEMVYYIHNGGYTWNDSLLSSRPWFCRDSDNAFTGTSDGPLCSSCVPACLGRVQTFCQPFTFYSLTTKRGNMYSTEDKIVDGLCAVLWTAMLILLMAI